MHIDNRPLTVSAADAHDRADGQAALDVQQPTPIDRRRMLSKAALAAPVVAAGAALGPFAGLLPRAAAQSGTDAPSDFDLLAFYETLELSAAQIYTAAAKQLTGDAAAVAAFGEHHTEHAALFTDMISKAGLTPPGVSNPGIDKAYAPRIASANGLTGTLEVLFEFESALAATYLEALGAIENGAAAATIASILPVDAQHAVVIGTALGRDVQTLVPEAQTTTDSLTVSQYPVPVEAESDSGSASTPSTTATATDSTDSGATPATS